MPPSSHIEAVLWDFGGVLTTSPFDAFNRFERQRDIPRDFIRSINATNAKTNAWAKFESSQISMEEFDRAFLEESTQAGFPIRGRQVINLLSGELRPRMVRALRRCKQDYKVACLTNNVKIGSGSGPGMANSPTQATKIAQVMEMFDLVLESSREGVRKPESEFYLRACERLGINCEQAVFLDDLGINLKSAREMGMATIKVLDETQALSELSALLKIDFD